MPPQDTTPTKRCSRCGETKPLDEFHKSKKVRDGRTARCKACMGRDGAAWRAANPDYMRAYYAENRDALSAAEKAREQARKAAPPTFDPITPKVCSLCKTEKPISAFYPKVSGRFGVTGRCRACLNTIGAAHQRANPEQAVARKRANYQRHRDRYNEASKARYWADPESDKRRSRRYRTEHHAEQLDKERRRRERPEDREYQRNYNRAYHRAHSAEMMERARQWAKANPERHRLLANNTRRRRQARKAGAALNDFTAAQWRETMAYFDHRCAYCNRPVSPLTQEHMTPISRGGDHTAANIVPACGSCNSRKGARTLLELLIEQR